MAIEGIKIIYSNSNHINEKDDPSYDYLVEVTLSPPGLMEFAFVCLHGGSEVMRARCKDLVAVRQLMNELGLERHPRLRSLKITGPDGDVSPDMVPQLGQG